MSGTEEGRGPDLQDRPWQPTPVPVDWLWNTLTVGGPAERVEAFRAAAAGSGVVPWVLDLAALEEEFLLPMAAPTDGVRAISLSGAKILARRLRDAAAVNHQAALARLAKDRSCPFDLHRLLPVPPGILAMGPEEGVSREWLRAHWGVTRPLRHAEALPATLDGRKKRMGQLRVGFWSADWSPWAAVARLRRVWPELSFELRPHYPGGSEDSEPEREVEPPKPSPAREGKSRPGRARTGKRPSG